MYRSRRRRCSVKKVFLEISQYSQENTCCQGLNFIKKDTRYMCFPVNFAKFLRTTFLTEQLWWLLLEVLYEFIIRGVIFYKFRYALF